MILTNLKLCCRLESVNDNYGKEMLDKNTSNLLSQENLSYEFSTLDKAALEQKYVKPSLGNLKLRNRMVSFSVKSPLTPSEISLSYFSLWFQIILMRY